MSQDTPEAPLVTHALGFPNIFSSPYLNYKTDQILSEQITSVALEIIDKNMSSIPTLRPMNNVKHEDLDGEITTENNVLESTDRLDEVEEIKSPEDSQPNGMEAKRCIARGSLKPVFLNEHQRKFNNPISYLGGPSLTQRNRWSLESVMSLD
nr:unnamed protein product [Callosobruchus chinensis]